MSLSTTQYGYIVDPMVPFTDDKGKTIKNGFIRVFMAGTSTPVLTYRNYDGATNQEKIELDNSGRVKHNVIGSKGSLYKVVVYNILHSQENPLLTVDKIAVLGASINATGSTIVTGLDSVTVQEENFLKATVEGTGVELALDPTEVTSEVSTIGDAATAAPDYVVPLLEKTGTEDGKKISLANLFKFALDWISRLATTVTSFASGDYFAVSNTTNGARKMSKDTLLELTAQNALAGNAAIAFVPNETNAVAGFPYAYGGKVYVAKENYNGAWDGSKFTQIPLSDISFLAKSPYIAANQSSNPLHLSDLVGNFATLVQRTSSTTIDDFPSEYPVGGSGNEAFGVLVALRNKAQGSTVVDFQILQHFVSGKRWVRWYSSASHQWTNWSYFKSAQDELSVKTPYPFIFTNYGTNPADLNNIKENCDYIVMRSSGTTTQNFPSDFPTDSSNMSLLSVRISYTTTAKTTFVVTQKLSSPLLNKYWFRYYSSASGTWTTWLAPAPPDVTEVKTPFIVTNYDTNPADLNDIKENCDYLVMRSASTATLNFPSDFPTDSSNFSMLSVRKAYTTTSRTTHLVLQFLESPLLGKKWFRSFASAAGTWSAWSRQDSLTKIITIGSGGMFATLRAGFEYANTRRDVEIHVLPGTYDLIVEFADKLPTISSSNRCVNYVGKGMRVIFYDGAKVVANFDNSGGTYTAAQWDAIQDYFEPFRCSDSDCTIENLNIETSNCRYCVHDECGGSTTPYAHKFINCHMKHNSTQSGKTYMACIGGGLGLHGSIVVDGGEYESYTTEGISEIDSGDPTSAQRAISYHNDSASAAKSSVVIKNVYIHDRGYIEVKSRGSSTEKTRFLVSGVSSGLPPLEICSSGYSNFNCEFLEWNSEKRLNFHWELLTASTCELVADS